MCAGAHKTLALVGGSLFYQAADGVRVYGSSGTTLLSGRWGGFPGCAGAFAGKYYLYLPERGPGRLRFIKRPLASGG